MLKKEIESAITKNGLPRVCDTCRSAACAVYCQADSAYLCAACDSRVHAANRVASRHERVWLCEACERVPAAFFCRADSASLCAACDADIHFANPLGRRHHHVPISGCLYDTSRTPGPGNNDDGFFIDDDEEEDEDEVVSWLLLNPVKNDDDENNKQRNGGFVVCGEVDEYLDLGEFNQFGEDDDDHCHLKQQDYIFNVGNEKSYHGDSVVPINKGRDYLEQIQQRANFQLGMDYESAETTGYDYPASISHSASVSSMDVGVVPESTVGVSRGRSVKGTIDLFSGPPPMVQMGAAERLSGAEREARVLRYREKKKARKFEKTIRYASRKANAESRPRIKGRFARRNDVAQRNHNHRIPF